MPMEEGNRRLQASCLKFNWLLIISSKSGCLLYGDFNEEFAKITQKSTEQINQQKFGNQGQDFFPKLTKFLI